MDEMMRGCDFRLTPEGHGDSILHCPGCGLANLHSERVTVYDRPEDAGLTIRTIGDGLKSSISMIPSSGDNPSSRRHGIVIQFSCEHCDTRAKLCLAQHKGTTRVTWD